jgi:hypothetical protein
VADNEESIGSRTILDVNELLGATPRPVDMDAAHASPHVERKREPLREMKIRFADTQGRRSSAGMLIQKMYSWRGYPAGPLDPNPSRVSLVASNGSTTLATITIGFDSDGILLADELYGQEVDALRARGERLCEFIKFAVDHSVQSKRVLASLFQIAYIFAHFIHGRTKLLIEVTPRHARFYTDMLRFVQVGEEKINPRVQTRGVLLALDFELVTEQIRLFGGQPHLAVTEKSLYPYAFSPQEQNGIAQRLRQLA